MSDTPKRLGPLERTRPRRPPMQRLAEEIGAHYRAGDETDDARALWIKLLAWTVGRFTSLQHRYSDKVEAWCSEIVFATSHEDLQRTLLRVRDQISRVDCDDGWATDPAGSALEGVCLAHMTDTRWLAEAGSRVWHFAVGASSYNEVVAISRKAWLCEIYRRAVDGIGPGAAATVERLGSSICPAPRDNFQATQVAADVGPGDAVSIAFDEVRHGIGQAGASATDRQEGAS